MFGGELFWLKTIHQFYPVGEKVEISPHQPMWRYVEQKLPLTVNLIHWNSSEPLKYYMPASADQKEQPRRQMESEARSKNSSTPSRILRISAVQEPPSFSFPKFYTMEEDIIACQQRAEVLRAYKNIKGRRHRERSLEVLDMVDELPPRNSDLSDNARALQEAKCMPLDAIIEQLEKNHKDLQTDLATQSGRLLEKLQAEGAMHQGKIAISGLEYLTGPATSGKVAQKKKQTIVGVSELADSGLRSRSGVHGPKSSIRTFLPTAEEEEFVLQVEDKKVLSGRQPNCSSQNRDRNLFLAPTVNQTGNNAFQNPAESVGCRNASDAFVCQICNTLEDDEENPIVFCSKCSITVHKACYRMDAVPSEHQDWICRLCENFGQKGRLLSCALCTRRGGALFPTTMKSNDSFLKKIRSLAHSSKRNGNSANHNPGDFEIDVANRPLIGSENVLRAIETDRTKDPKFYHKLDYNYNLEPHEYTSAELTDEPVSDKAWVHWTCGFWVPGLDFDFEQGLIHQIDQVDPYRFELQCLLCSQSRLWLKTENGACVQCCGPDCTKAYHPECARRYGIFIGHGYQSYPLWRIYCPEHEDNKIIKQLKESFQRRLQSLSKLARHYEEMMKLKEPSFDEKHGLLKQGRDEIKVPVMVLHKKPQKPRFKTKKPLVKPTPKTFKIVIDATTPIDLASAAVLGRRIRGRDGRFIKPDKIAKLKARSILGGFSDSRIESKQNHSSATQEAETPFDPTELGLQTPIAQVIEIPAKKRRRRPRKKGEPRRHYMSTTNEDASTNQLEGPASSEFDSIAVGPLNNDPLGKRKKPNQCELPEGLLSGPDNNKRMLLANQTDLAEVMRIKEASNTLSEVRKGRQERRRKFEDSKDREKLMQIIMHYNVKNCLWEIENP